MTITEAIQNVSNIYVMTIVNEDEFQVSITSEQAMNVIEKAHATKAVLNSDTNNFYVDPEIRHTQVAWFDNKNNALVIGQ